MNVLLFVTAMIMCLSILTYTRLETYKSASAFEGQFLHFMQETERSKYNIAAKKLYKKTPAKSGTGTFGKKMLPPPRLNFKIFTNKTFREQYKVQYPLMKEAMKNLIIVLYKDQPSYQRIEAKRPGFIDDFFQAFIEAVDNIPFQKRPRKVEDLGAISLDDPLLNRFSYEIFKGTIDYKKGPVKLAESQNDDKKDKEDEDEFSDLFVSQEGYYSLYDFITLDDKMSVRVFLASRPVLLALFGNEEIVEEVIKQRNEIYKILMDSSNVDRDELKNRFKGMFEGSAFGGPGGILDFSVSKTDPRSYE